METAFLNQIATFRLARRELTDEDRRVETITPWGLCPTAISRPTSDQASFSFNIPRHSFPGLLDSDRRELASMGSSQRQASPNQVSPMEIPAFTPDPATIEIAALDREQYLRMAEEIGEYITWDPLVAEWLG